MIHIEKSQNVSENEGLKVATETGDYSDDALIQCYDENNPDIVAGSFQAQYVKYGSIVYKFNTPKDLGEEILKIDPESTHTAASYVRMSNELLNQMNGGTLEIKSLDQVITSEQNQVKEKIEENELLEEELIEEIPQEETEEIENEIPEEVPINEVEISEEIPVIEIETINEIPPSLNNEPKIIIDNSNLEQ